MPVNKQSKGFTGKDRSEKARADESASVIKSAVKDRVNESANAAGQTIQGVTQLAGASAMEPLNQLRGYKSQVLDLTTDAALAEMNPRTIQSEFFTLLAGKLNAAGYTGSSDFALASLPEPSLPAALAPVSVVGLFPASASANNEGNQLPSSNPAPQDEK